MKKLRGKDQSAAIRAVIDDRLLADEVMARVWKLRQRGTLRDAYKRAVRG